MVAKCQPINIANFEYPALLCLAGWEILLQVWQKKKHLWKAVQQGPMARCSWGGLRSQNSPSSQTWQRKKAMFNRKIIYKLLIFQFQNGEIPMAKNGSDTGESSGRTADHARSWWKPKASGMEILTATGGFWSPVVFWGWQGPSWGETAQEFSVLPRRVHLSLSLGAF